MLALPNLLQADYFEAPRDCLDEAAAVLSTLVGRAVIPSSLAAGCGTVCFLARQEGQTCLGVLQASGSPAGDGFTGEVTTHRLDGRTALLTWCACTPSNAAALRRTVS